MNKEWSLDFLYQGFEDVKFKQDKEEFIRLTNEMTSFSEKLKKDPQEETDFIHAIEYLEKYQLLGSKLAYYTVLRQSADTLDSDAMNQMNEIEKLIGESSSCRAAIKKYIAQVEQPEKYEEKYPKLKEYRFFIEDNRKNSRYLLSDEVENVIAKLNISAGAAWNKLQSFLTSTLEVPYKDSTVTLSQIRNLAYDKDSAVRKEAYEAELAALENIKDAVSYSLNNIKTQVNTICDLRGYQSPLEMALIQCAMKKETLDAMMEAIRESLPVFRKYLKHKAKVLGHAKALPWYDLFAPMGETDRKFTVEEAKEYLLKHFRTFSEEEAGMIEEAFDNAWIDFYPRKGKVGGAFCENIPCLKQSCILTNFTGNLGDVTTLAHELGHAYHGLVIQDHLPLNTDYGMAVAETASTFNEAVVMEAAIAEAEDKEKLVLIEEQLQGATQIICDIYSRFLFESEVFDRSRTDFLPASELNEIMLRCQKEVYGDGLDPDYLHPYMWTVKSHYYSEEISFYNFPYAFGGLLANGLYEKYREEKEAFVPKYRAFLKATTVKTAEDAAREADIDLMDTGFWRKALQAYEELIEEFIRLA